MDYIKSQEYQLKILENVEKLPFDEWKMSSCHLHRFGCACNFTIMTPKKIYVEIKIVEVEKNGNPFAVGKPDFAELKLVIDHKVMPTDYILPSVAMIYYKLCAQNIFIMEKWIKDNFEFSKTEEEKRYARAEQTLNSELLEWF